MAAQRLRPLGVGEVLDTAIKVYRAHFATLVKAVFLVVAPVQVLVALVNISLPDFGHVSTTDELGRTTFDAANLRGAIAAIVITGLLGFIASQLATATSLKVVSSAYLGEAEDWRSSLRFAMHRLPSLIWLAFLTGVLGGLAFLACVIPFIYFIFAWAVAVPVLLLEDRRGLKALKRSRELVKGRWGPVFACIIVGMLLAGIITGVFQGILVGVVFSSSNETVRAVATAIASVAASALVTPFTAAVAAILYFDLRVRKEGFDLELLARTMGVEPSADDEPWAFGLPEPPRPGDDDQPPYWPPPPGWRPREG